MKRLLAMLMSVLFSIFNNVDYQASDNVDFSPDSYYYIEGSEVPDFKSVYIGNPADESKRCVQSSEAVKGAHKVTSTNSSTVTYWLAPERVDITTISGYGMEYTFTQEQAIVAPRRCKIYTHAASGGGHSMDLITLDNAYRFHVENMERWYCCRNRDALSDSTSAWQHTTDIYGETIDDGYLIGNAQIGTTVSVYKYDGADWVQISISDYYNR